MAGVSAGTEEPQVTIANLYLLQDLSPEELADVSKMCHKRQFATGEIIFRAGDEGTSFFLTHSCLVDFLVKATAQRDRRLVTMRSGMSLCETALVKESSRSTDARTVIETLCYELYFVDISPNLKAKMVANLAKELWRRLSKEARELQALGWGKQRQASCTSLKSRCSQESTCSTLPAMRVSFI